MLLCVHLNIGKIFFCENKIKYKVSNLLLHTCCCIFILGMIGLTKFENKNSNPFEKYF